MKQQQQHLSVGRAEETSQQNNLFHNAEGGWHLDRVKSAAAVPNVKQGVAQEGVTSGGRW